ncbi:MAG: DegV family protein [Candidatus Hadarchaeum sp.]
MRKIAIVTDSSANLPRELVEKHHIFVVPVLIYLDGREYHDGVDVTPSDIYRYLRASSNGNLPKTATPSVGDFLRTYAQALQQAEEIVSIHLAKELSAVCQTAELASKLVDAPVHVLDCRTAALGCGFAALEAARLADSGADASAVLERAREIAQKTRIYASLDTLYYLHRGGHVPSIASLAGSALKLCPILSIGNGQARLVELPRTRRRAVSRLLELIYSDVGKHPVHAAVMHADVPEEAEALRDELARNLDCRELFITEFTPVMGTHTGPGLIGLAWWAEPEANPSQH